jgi:hypothetical protein
MGLEFNHPGAIQHEMNFPNFRPIAQPNSLRAIQLPRIFSNTAHELASRVFSNSTGTALACNYLPGDRGSCCRLATPMEKLRPPRRAVSSDPSRIICADFTPKPLI